MGVLYCIARANASHRNLGRSALWFGFMFFIVLIGSRQAVLLTVQPYISQTQSGNAIQPVTYIDIEAIPARVTWLDPNTKPPAVLADPFLLYLGHGAGGEVLIACGAALTVPASQVAIEDGFDLKRSATPGQRKHFCESVQSAPVPP